jgi:ERCC4-type nuclease
MGQEDKPVLIGIERKTMRDLAGSMESGRLQGHQLPGLLASYNVVYLIVEGIVRSNENGTIEEKAGGQWRSLGVNRKSFDSFLNTLEVLAHVIVRQTTWQKTTADLILHLYQWWQKGWDNHKGHLGFALSPPPTLQLHKPSLFRRIAKELPGIGWEKSKAVESYFGSVGAMVLATEDDWANIKGVSARMSTKIIKELKGNA